MHEPELGWVSNDQLEAFAVKRFRKSVRKVQSDSLDELSVEPTLAVVRAGITGVRFVDDDELNVAVALTKTIQNAVGLFHQDVLGAVSGWASTGAAGGLVDLRGVSPLTHDPILAEVKMRWNTIKSSDEKDTWDKLRNARRTDVRPGTIAYIFQIVPKDRLAYDHPWRVSARQEDPQVRAADGVTAYHLVTGDPRALRDLLEAMPWVTLRMLERITGDSSTARAAFANASEVLEGILDSALPSSSALAL